MVGVGEKIDDASFSQGKTLTVDQKRSIAGKGGWIAGDVHNGFDVVWQGLDDFDRAGSWRVNHHLVDCR